MTSPAASYHGYRFPPEIISHAVWLYHRFCLSFRDTEDLLAQRSITVSYEAIRQWCGRFGALVHNSRLADSDLNSEATHRRMPYDSGRPSSVI